ncbi:MAG: EAL domain-containing protein [Actinomycetota bacterium]
MGDSSTSALLRRTRLTLVAVLVIIGSLVVVQGVVSSRLVSGQTTAGDEINVAGRQRMLTQRVGLYTGAASEAAGDDRIALLVGLARLRDELGANHRDLQEGNPSRNVTGELSSTAQSILDDAPYHVSDRVEELIGLVDDIIASGGASPDDPRVQRVLTMTTDASSRGLLEGLDRFVSVLAAESRADVDRLATFGLTIGTTIVLALIGVWFATFRPLAKQIRSSVDEMHAAQAELDAVAHNDPLTGLPNRRGLERHLTTRDERQIALAMLDLDGFKQVNDSLGHPAGDALLLEIAGRLRAWAQPDDFIARLGGDEFAIILTELDHDRVRTRADHLAIEIAQPIDVGGTLAAVSTSIGYQIGSAADMVGLARDADTALYAAKDAGRGHVVRFEPRMHDERTFEFEMANDLRRAIADAEFVNHYQPIVDLDHGEVRCLEAVVRWEHPRLGLLTPDRFLETAGRDHRIVRAIHTHVTAAALRDLASLRSTLSSDLEVSLNVPGRLVDQEFIDALAAELAAANLPGRSLHVEISEHDLISHDIHRHLDGFRAIGVRVAVDDFGTGYCSLAQLHDLTIDTLKLDMQFVQSIETRGVGIARAVVAMADELGLDVIAEGIETAAQRDALRELGVPLGQGTLWTGPAPATAALDMLLAPRGLTS